MLMAYELNRSVETKPFSHIMGQRFAIQAFYQNTAGERGPCKPRMWRSEVRAPQLLVGAIVLGACLVGLSACGAHEEAPRPRTVETVIAEQASGFVSTVYSGQVVSRFSSNYAPRVGGLITHRLVEIGDQVLAGQLLARIDPKDVDVSVRTAQAQLSAAAARADATAADLERARELAAKGFISKAELDQVTAEAAGADAQLRAARAQQTGADQQRSYTELRSLRAGVVTSVLADVGEVVAAGQPVVTVEAPNALEVAVSVPEGEVAQFRSADLSVRVWTDQTRTFPAEIRVLSAAANPQTRTFDARVAFVSPADVAALGGTAEVLVQQEAKDALARVPLTAVVNTVSGETIVWVISGEPPKAMPRVVTIQSVQDNAVLLSSGVTAGERVASAGAHLLHRDEIVRPVQTSAGTAQ